MFSQNKAFSGFSVNDTAKAKEFYTQVLGMKVKKGEMGTLQLKIANDSVVLIYPKPNHVPAEFTILNFPVSDIDKAVDELTERGVKFIQYDNETIKTDNKGVMRGNGPNIAWFNDPAGNIFSVIETEMP